MERYFPATSARVDGAYSSDDDPDYVPTDKEIRKAAKAAHGNSTKYGIYSDEANRRRSNEAHATADMDRPNSQNNAPSVTKAKKTRYKSKQPAVRSKK